MSTDFSDTIERLGDFQEYVVTRYKTRGTTNGKADPLRIDTTITITAAIQPASGRDLARLGEGFRLSEVVVIWTATMLRVLDEDTGKPPDTIVYEDEIYQVESCDRWHIAGNYYEALARRVPPPVVTE